MGAVKRLRVVPSLAEPDDGAAATERRGPGRRSAEARIDAAVRHGGWLIAWLALWLALVTGRLQPQGGRALAGLAGVAVVLLLVWLALTLAWLGLRWRLPRRSADKRPWWRAWQGVAGLNLLLPGLLPWLWPSFGQAFDLAAWAAVQLMLVAGCIAALPMLPWLGRLASLGLLSGATAIALAGPDRRVAAAGVALAGAVSLFGWLASGSAGRRWMRRTAELIETGERLRRVSSERDAAQRADADKRRFVAAASHDLRQPMHALGLFVATLERHLKGTADEALVRNMMRSIEALDRSFGALLDLSRLEAGAVQPNVQRFPLRDVFRRLHMHFAGQAEELGLGLRFSAGGKAVNSDPQLLERILSNLIQNALRYTREGGVVVVARSAAHQIRLEVWDTGRGISEADLPRVFDEFYRVPDSARSHIQGLGMGLAIVKRLVALLGHTLEVSSQPGRGTMFRIGIASGPMAEVEDATAAADTLPAPFVEARCVLLVDDEAPIREGLWMLLTEWGFEPVAVADLAGAEAAAHALGDRLDLVISDLHLQHGEDGLDVIERVRQVCGRQVAAILVTGDTSPAEIRRASASGHRVLFKPVQPSKLFNVLRALVD
ncbi:histidine kinase [Leptothrix cholodnii SP-6]|uniref:histidine kinase n=1 Tax=Leptothrix cholodnii (strain ATCC 51168 / LMG 8142 / SP-6) TaxID=395495 RepID=B1XXM9_LEPCP|nr:histidine kinase [Leptothrix cholodnii SP-6]